ncbi:TrbI/VirB10 family protein, partial [Paracoccus denitrificans]
LFSTENRTTADGLAELPRDYSGPVLGPALPGDLGKPILNARNRGEPVPAPAPDIASPLEAVPAMDAAEQQRLAEEEAARLSGVFFQGGPRPAGGPDTGAGSAGSASGGSGTMGEPGATSAQDRHAAFLGAAADRITVVPDRVEAPASPYILQAGSVIPAALVTGIRSDLPGQIIAQVTQPVYDSPTGSILLIPQGTRIIGEYDADVTFGQRRVLLVWNRLIYPDGRSLVLERLPGADASGYAGLEDGVDYHWGELMKVAGLSTLLAVGTELAAGDEEDRLIRAIRDGAQDTVNQAGQQIVQRQLQVAPTLTIRPGFPVRILVSRDLVFENAGG